MFLGNWLWTLHCDAWAIHHKETQKLAKPNKHKLLLHWNLRLRICTPQIPFHMEGCMCICTSLKQNYIYIICILFIYNSLKLYLQCQDLEWQTLMNILPSKTSATRLEEGCNTHILCNTHQSTNLGKPKFETILKHSHLRRFWFWKPRFGHCLQHVFNKKCQINFKTRGGAFNKYQNTIHGRSATIVSLKSSPISFKKRKATSWKRN